MGYILELRAGNLSDITNELTEPTIDAQAMQLDDPELEAMWPDIQTLVANTIAEGQPATATSEVADYISRVIQQLTHWWAALQHTSSGGTEFRTSLTDGVANALGRDFTVHLVTRPIHGIAADDHPLFGWVGNAEIERALDRAHTRGLAPHEEQSDDLRTILRILGGAIEHELDIITTYL